MLFQHKDILLNNDDPEEEYRRRKDEEKKSISWGQRKLLLTLVSFLTEHCMDIENAIILYVGAGPGVNIGITADLFPKFTFHLYDPAKFKIKTDFSKKIIVYNKKFTDEIAEFWSKKNNIIFISDIRTADYTKTKDLNENENQILSDMEHQKRWVEIIKPVKSHLKFRLNYTGDGRQEKMEYFDGIIYKQPYAPNTSSETRLVLTSSDLKYKTYDCKKYESQMFYHNIIIREQNKYEKSIVDGVELVNDWDSCCELEIWKKYLEINDSEEDILKLSEKSTVLLTKGRKYQDTLAYLRANPQAIKNRNFKRKK